MGQVVAIKQKPSLKEQLDAIDHKVERKGKKLLYEFTLNVFIAQWEKGEAVSYFVNLKNTTSYYQLEPMTGRRRANLKQWHQIYLSNPDIDKYIEQVAKPKAELWTKNRLKKEAQCIDPPRPLAPPGMMVRKELIDAMLTAKQALGKESATFESLQYYSFVEDWIRCFMGTYEILVPFHTGLSFFSKHGLLDILESNDSEFIKMETHERENNRELIIQSENRVDKIQVLLKSDFPEMWEISELEWKPLADDFMEGLRLCFPHVAIQSDLIELEGLYVDGRDMMSSDRWRASWYRLNSEMPYMLIPQFTVKALLRHPSTCRYALITRKYKHTEDKYVFFDLGDGCILRSVLRGGKYPIKKSLFDKDKYETRFTMPDITEAIKSSLAHNYCADRLDYQMKITFGDGIVECFTEGGHSESKITLPYSGTARLEIVINPRYLKDLLSVSHEIVCSETGVMAENGNLTHVAVIE